MAAGTGFPYVLYDLLKKESSSIVMWTSTGTAFGIRDMTAFRQEVLTCYFKHNKFSSFQRQLNLYGFRKVVKGRESGCYMHPSFLRDSPERLTEVKRGVVPPCPPHYSRKIYGSGPRFMSQDDGSDSEPELVVQPRGHWDKSLTHSDVATHMKLGEMHVTAAALAAARAQMKDSTTGMHGMNASHAAAATAAAVHLQAAQAELHGIPGHSRPQPPPFPPHQMMRQMGGHLPSPSTSQGMDVGGRLGPQQHEVDMAGMMRGLHPGEVSMSGNGGGPESGGRYTGVVGGSGCGATTGAPGGEGFRGRPGRTSLSKMFGSKRPPMVATAPGEGVCSGSVGGMPPPPSSFMAGGGGSGSSVSGSQQQRMHQHHHGQHQLHPQQQQQQQLFQQQRQHRMMEQHRYNAPSLSDAQGGGSSRGPMGSGHVFSLPFMVAGGQGGRTEGGDMPMGSAPGGGSAIGILNAKAPSPGAAPSRTSHSSTVASLNRLLEGLEHTLDCPPEDEMYTPIDKRNSFCAQMVSIAQVLEDDPMMHGFEEGKNSLSNLHASHLAQKRRSSVSELAAYLQDMLDGGESTRSITIPPGLMLPPPVQRGEGECSEDGNGNGGAGNRGAFKRTFDGDYGSYDSFGMDGSGGDVSANLADAADAPIVPPDGCSRSATAPGSWECAIKRDGGGAGGSSNHADSSPRSNPKRARATPPPPILAPFSGDSVGRHRVWMEGEIGQGQRQAREEDAAISRRNSVRMSLEAARAAGKIAASPNLVQALTCLASGLPGLSDSEESRDGGSMEALGTWEGEHSAQGDPGALAARKGDMTSVRVKDEEATGKEEDSESERAVDAAAEAVAGELAKDKNSRRGSNAINDVLTNFSIDRALEQLKTDDGKSDDEEAAGGRADGSQSGMRHRASVYVLMHAIARVNTSNDQEAWQQREGQEPLDCSEGGFAAVI